MNRFWLAPGSGLSLPTPSTMLVSGRTLITGSTFPVLSNGTDTGSNSRISMFNETGADITQLRSYYTGWYADGTNEINNPNNITVRAALEYPAGTFQVLNFTGVRDVVIAPGQTIETDSLTLASASPANAQFWIRTYVTVSSGQFWPRQYLALEGTSGRPALGEAIDLGTSTTDLTTSGTITNVAGARGYGPVGVKATAFNGTPKKIAIVGIGDSIMQGSGDGIYDSRGNQGWIGRATTTRCPFVNFGISGTTAQQNVPANYTRRLALINLLKPTIAVVNYGVNDLNNNRSQAQILADLQLIWDSLNNNGYKVVQTTLTPNCTSTDVFVTVANQTPKTTPAGVWAGGSGSRRATTNAALRARPLPLWDLIENANVTESAQDSGLWNVNTGWTNAAYTTDGVHPNNTNTVQQSGGHYVLRDNFINNHLTPWALL